MVYRSSRRSAQKAGEAEGIELQDVKFSDDMDKGASTRRQVGLWRAVAIIAVFVCICLLVAVVVLLLENGGSGLGGVPVCGRGKKVASHNVIDRSEPARPGPFHDLTKDEIRRLRTFLENDPNIKAVKAEGASMTQSIVYMMDLFPAPKKEVLKFLDEGGKQPPRQARVLMFRGDKNPAVVEEYVCGPLADVTSCDLLKSPKRRNPVEFTVRPVGLNEFMAIYEHIFVPLDKKIGHILQEQYGATYTSCSNPEDCFKPYPSPMGTNLTGNINSRRMWFFADYATPYYVLHPVDFGVLIIEDGSDPSKFTYGQLWFRGQLYQNADELMAFYNATRPKRTVWKPENAEQETSSLFTRGDPLPKQPQRPPMLVEPDGHRYSLKQRKIDYLGWELNFRMSALTGPQVYDVKYKGERIVYEMGIAEIAVYYSAGNPVHRSTDFVDSGALIGTMSKSLVPGADCPETATFVNSIFNGEVKTEPVEIKRSFCVFENNNGHPLRRHLSYSQHEGGYYGGMMDSALILRTVLTIVNYDYVADFIFHQNGVIETRVMSTGYILPSFYTPQEDPYGFQIEKHLVGNVHHHMFHFKVDIDIHGTSNRYETLDIVPDTVTLRTNGKEYHQTKVKRSLKSTEKEALFKYNFDQPKYHVVHNDAKKTKYGVMKAYRILMSGMSKQMIPEDFGNEGTIPWARHQLVVTKQKDDEKVSSSPYAMWDSANPVTDFTTFYEDDENIKDEDLVFWVTQGMHHIPHTEDLPLTPTVGNHLAFFLMPNNYFKECPSVASRDHIRIEHKNPAEPKEGVHVLRNGNSKDVCSMPPVAQEFDDLVEEDPDLILESRGSLGLF